MAKPLFSFFCGKWLQQKNVIDLVNKCSDHESDRWNVLFEPKIHCHHVIFFLFHSVNYN